MMCVMCSLFDECREECEKVTLKHTDSLPVSLRVLNCVAVPAGDGTMCRDMMWAQRAAHNNRDRLTISCLAVAGCFYAFTKDRIKLLAQFIHRFDHFYTCWLFAVNWNNTDSPNGYSHFYFAFRNNYTCLVNIVYGCDTLNKEKSLTFIGPMILTYQRKIFTYKATGQGYFQFMESCLWISIDKIS